MTRSSIVVVALSLFITLQNGRRVAANCTIPPGSCCNICANGGEILNPGKQFDMYDSQTGQRWSWTCGWLQTVMGDVNNGATGAAGEAAYCGLAQLWARLECECSGDPLPPLPSWDINPACDLCGNPDGSGNQLARVPDALQHHLADTTVAGRMPCGSLENALAYGAVLSADLCPTVQRTAGRECCNPTTISNCNAQGQCFSPNPGASTPPPPTPSPTPQPTQPQPTPSPTESQESDDGNSGQCIAMHQTCADDSECCGNLECRLYAIGAPTVCRSPSNAASQSGVP